MTNSPSGSCRVLVVDDNPDAAFTLFMLLKLKGYDAHVFYSGREGLTAAEHLQPDVVVLDLAMPEMDGYETCRMLREQPRGNDLVIIALSGYNQPEDIQLGWESGFDAHLAKPVNLDTLQQLMATHLEIKKGNQ